MYEAHISMKRDYIVYCTENFLGYLYTNKLNEIQSTATISNLILNFDLLQSKLLEQNLKDYFKFDSRFAIHKSNR